VKERNPAFDPRRSDVDTDEIINFITACRADDESFDLLIEAIETRTSRDYPNLYRLQVLVEELLPRALVTAGELRELLALAPSTGVRPVQLAVGMRKAIYGHAGNGVRGLKPVNVREAMLLLLDDPSPEEGLRRLLRFADWLADFASVAGDDPSIGGRLHMLAVQVGRAHGMSPEQWQIPVEATPHAVAGAASAADVRRNSAEDSGTGDRLPYRPSQVAELPAGLNNRERTTRAAQGRKERRYLVDGNASALTILSPHQRSLRDLDNALKRIKPNIFRDPRIKSSELSAAKKALESVDPLMAALSEAARAEAEQSVRDDLLQLEHDLRKYLESLSRELAKLGSVPSQKAAEKPCDRLAGEAARFLNVGALAVRHVT
jgi:hypothetical protein